MDSAASIYLLAPLMGWFFAHVAKFTIQLVKSKGKKVDPAIFFESGGMPSSHSSVMVATLVVIGAREGIDSAIFGLAVAVTAVIIYDAINVRRSVGEQGEVLGHLVGKLNADKPFFTARGHTVTEVFAGSLLGLVVGLVLLQIL